MTKTRRVRVRRPVDLLAMVPCLLGFHPEDSLVLLTIGEAANAFHARVDLPADRSDVDAVVGSLCDAVRRHAVSAVAIVTYSDDHTLSVEVFAAVRDLLAEHEASVLVAIRADGGRWYCLDCLDCMGESCAGEGTAYDLASHPFTAQSVLEGRVVLSSRRELADSLVGADPEAIAAVARAAERAAARRDVPGDVARHALGPEDTRRARAHEVGEGRWVGDRVTRYLADGQPLDTEDTGRLLVAIRSIDVRDVAWAEMRRSNAAQHVTLWRDVLQRSPYDLVAAPAALLGFAAWLSGDGALAWCAVERCQQVDPDYRLAALLSAALVDAVPPSAWRPIPRSELTLFAGGLEVVRQRADQP